MKKARHCIATAMGLINNAKGFLDEAVGLGEATDNRRKVLKKQAKRGAR